MSILINRFNLDRAGSEDDILSAVEEALEIDEDERMSVSERARRCYDAIYGCEGASTLPERAHVALRDIYLQELSPPACVSKTLASRPRLSSGAGATHLMIEDPGVIGCPESFYKLCIRNRGSREYVKLSSEPTPRGHKRGSWSYDTESGGESSCSCKSTPGRSSTRASAVVGGGLILLA